MISLCTRETCESRTKGDSPAVGDSRRGGSKSCMIESQRSGGESQVCGSVDTLEPMWGQRRGDILADAVAGHRAVRRDLGDQGFPTGGETLPEVIDTYADDRHWAKTGDNGATMRICLGRAQVWRV